MELILRDTEKENPLAAKIRHLDYDYQAEQWVMDTARSPNTQNPARWVIEWELVDDTGVRAVWQRPDGDPGLPKLVAVSTYYTGEWKVGT